MRNIKTIGFLIGMSFFGISANAEYEILELGDGKGNPGPVKIRATYKDKLTQQEEIFFLETLKGEDVPALMAIRKNAHVVATYGEHNTPADEEVRGWLESKLLPRVRSGESLFPFTLKNVIGEVKGLVNIGKGYEDSHRMFGVYTDPGMEDGEWKRGRGTAAVHTAGDFMMLWHENHPAQQIISVGDENVKLWGPTFKTLSATADANNIAGRLILEKFGMAMISATKIRAEGHGDEIGNKVYYAISDFDVYQSVKDQR